MPDDTGNHEIIADILHVGAVVSSGSNATAGTLEDQREKIAQDEDPCVVARLEARVLGADFQNAVLEGEVNASGKECR